MMQIPILIFSLVALFSCVNTDPEPIQYGPESSAEELGKALDQLQTQKTPLDIKQGEFVQKTTSLILSQGNAMNQATTGITITRRNLTETALEITSLQETKKYRDSQPAESFIRENFETIDLSMTAKLATQGLKSLMLKLTQNNEDIVAAISPFQKLMSQIQKSSSKVGRVTIHNLKLTEHTIPAPSLTRKLDKDCRGLVNCQVNIKQLSVDLVEWKSEDTGYRTSFTQWVTNDLPYIAAVMLDCQEVPIEIEGRNMLLKQCRTVDDFRP